MWAVNVGEPMEHMNNGAPSRQEFLAILQETRLLPTEDFERAAALPGNTGPALGEALVEAGLLTPFQRDEILQCRHERLRIGNYDVLDKLGTGGTGTVFKARHRRMKRVVALKVLTRSLCKDKTFVQRFQREVETIAQLSHPNIVMAYDADEAAAGHFLVMEFVSGPDLASVVQADGPLPLAAAVDAALQAARGLVYVHERGMIHRDIKPANLLRDPDGTVKVTDLGLARFSSAAGALGNNALTQAGGVLGSVDYMPPEQALDATTIDHRADIYILGATLYFLLTCGPPYPGQTMMETLLKHRDAPIPSARATRSDVPKDLDALVRRMLAKSPDDRFQSMSNVVTALEKVHNTLDTLGAETVCVGRDTITVPRAVSDHTMDLTALSAAPNAGLYVLLVEPSRTQASIIRKYLHSQEIRQVATVASGEEALKIVRTDRPDAIVGAMHLADMTGVQLARQIRTASSTPPGFVLIHAETENDDARALSKCAQATALQKPFTPAQLVEALSLVTGLFLVELPATPEQLGTSLVRPITLTAPAAPPKHTALRVLIVDDSKPARLHMRGVLTKLGLSHFGEARDGAEAVAMLARETYDLVVTDYNMPLMDGCNLVSYLKQNPATASLPVIMVTTETDPGKLAAVRALGVQAICEKQFPPEVVRGILEQLPIG